jgi:hypothetical protein
MLRKMGPEGIAKKVLRLPRTRDWSLIDLLTHGSMGGNLVCSPSENASR